MIRISVRGIANIQSKLNRLSEAVSVTGILDIAGAILLNRIRARFLRQESTEGDVWIESRAAKRRKATGRGGGTLFDTGKLFHSIHLVRSAPNERKIITNVVYAEKHQLGLEGMPKREFLGISGEDALVILSAINVRLRTAVR